MSKAGMSAFGGIWGGYLPIIDYFRNDLDYVHVQLYNSGSIYGIDGNIYTQGTADFIVAMTEALIQGFDTAGGHFDGLPGTKLRLVYRHVRQLQAADLHRRLQLLQR